jgi:hypothetical protein
MKTPEQILDSIRAREAGKTAAQNGENIGANPFDDENDERHWDWLDAWAVEKCAQRKRQMSNNPDGTTN